LIILFDELIVVFESQMNCYCSWILDLELSFKVCSCRRLSRSF